MLLVNFTDFFAGVIDPVIKPTKNGFGLEIYSVYLADSETRINLLYDNHMVKLRGDAL